MPAIQKPVTLEFLKAQHSRTCKQLEAEVARLKGES